MISYRMLTLVALATAGTLTACGASSGGSSPGGDHVAVAVSPATTNVFVGQSVQYAAAVTGSATRTVTWTVKEGSTGGTIDSAGLYTAPGAAGTFHVVATSAADTSVSGEAVVTVTSATGGGSFIQPGAVSGDVTVAIDSHTVKSISPYIYGWNFRTEINVDYPGYVPSQVTLDRWGGNAFSVWNWVTDYTNGGTRDTGGRNMDQVSNEGAFVSHAIPGDAARYWADDAFGQGSAVLFTVPLFGYAARDGDRNTPLGPPFPVSPLPGTRLVNASPSRPGGPTTTTATLLSDATALNGHVYTDDFVLWLKTKYPTSATAPGKRLFLCLDNEVDIYEGSHGEIRSTPVTPDELITKTLAHARAIKSVWPDLQVFGGVWMAQGGVWDMGANWPRTINGTSYPNNLEAFAAEMQKAAVADARLDGSGSLARVVDVIDFHHYTDANINGVDIGNNNDLVTQTDNLVIMRTQAPRTYWDPSFRENSWLDDYHGDGKPGMILPRMQATLAKYPQGPQKLAITEYFFGRGGDIANAIAHADSLGIFGREGLYAATVWPYTDTGATPYNNDYKKAYAGTVAAMKAFVNYDGAGSRFGDSFVQTVVTDPSRPADPNHSGQTLERITAYASIDAGNPNRMVVVAINKTLSAALNVGFQVTHTARFTKADAWQITGKNGNTAVVNGPTKLATSSFGNVNVVNATLPAQSITVLVFAP